jgi:regulatory protein
MLSLKGRALRCLAQRDHTRAELERKLAGHAEDQPEASAAEQIRSALDELGAHGLLDDARVAEAVLAGSGQRFGTRRLKLVLQAKGMSAELVAATLAQARCTELERAREAWRRRFGALPASAAERSRQLRFLAGRGFDGDVIHHVLQAGSDDDGV